MDEPLSALDDTLKFQIIPYLKSVSERFRIPYLFISHSIVEMRLMVDKVLVVSNGAIVEQTTPDELAPPDGGKRVGYIDLLRLSSRGGWTACLPIDGAARNADFRRQRRT